MSRYIFLFLVVLVHTQPLYVNREGRDANGVDHFFKNIISIAVQTDTVGNTLVVGHYTLDPLLVYHANGSLFATIPNNGLHDIFLAKYKSGTVTWLQHIGTSRDETSVGLAIGSDSASYVLFYSDGIGFVAKYSSSGVVMWTREVSVSSLRTIAFDLQYDGVHVLGTNGIELLLFEYAPTGILRKLHRPVPNTSVLTWEMYRTFNI